MSDIITIELTREQAARIKTYIEKDTDIAARKIAEEQKVLVASNKILEILNKKLVNGNANATKQTPLFVQSENKDESPNTFDSSWSNMEKVRFAFRQRNKLTTLKEVLDIWRIYEPSIGNGKDENYRRLQANISAALKGKIDKGIEFKRIKENHNDDFHYGFKEWFDDKGNVMPEYK